MVKKDADKAAKTKKSTTKAVTKKEETKEKTTTRKKKTKESSEAIIETPKEEKKTTKKTTKASKEPKKEEAKVEEKVVKKTTKKVATKKVDENKEAPKKTTKKPRTKKTEPKVEEVKEPIIIEDPEIPGRTYEITDAPPIKKGSDIAREKSLLLKPMHEPKTLLPKGYVPGSDLANIQKEMEAKHKEAEKPKKQGLLLTPVREPRTLLPKEPVKESAPVVIPPVKEVVPESVKEEAHKKPMSIADMLRAPSPKASTAKQTKDLPKEEVNEVIEVVEEVKKVEEVKEESKKVEDIMPVVKAATRPSLNTVHRKSSPMKDAIREAIMESDAAYYDVSTTDPIIYVGSATDPKSGEYVSTFRKSILNTDSSDYIVDIAFAIHNRFNQFDTNTIASLLTVRDITPSKFVVRI